MADNAYEDRLTKDTLEVIQRFNDVFNRHDVDAVMAAITEDCVFENTYPPPDGERGHIRGVDVFRVRDGKVAEEFAYVHIRNQTTAPAPAAPSTQ